MNQQTPVIADLHCDTVMLMQKGYDIAVHNTTNHIDIPRLKMAGVNLQCFACFVDPELAEDECSVAVDNMIDTLELEFEKHPDEIEICRTEKQAREVIESGRIAAILAIENGMAIESDLSKLEHFYHRGVRYMTLTHTVSTDWCISDKDKKPAFDGLTEFGEGVITAMNELGMMIDVSHVHASAIDKVIRITRAPIIASHSACKELCGHNRNLSDEHIQAIATLDGIIGLIFHGDFLSEKRRKITEAFIAEDPEMFKMASNFHFGKFTGDEYKEKEKICAPYLAEWEKRIWDVNASVKDVVDHIDHIVKLVGPDYVGFGSDFDGMIAPPDGLEDVTKTADVISALEERGYNEDYMNLIQGENFMRVFREVCP